MQFIKIVQNGTYLIKASNILEKIQVRKHIWFICWYINLMIKPTCQLNLRINYQIHNFRTESLPFMHVIQINFTMVRTKPKPLVI